MDFSFCAMESPLPSIAKCMLVPVRGRVHKTKVLDGRKALIRETPVTPGYGVEAAGEFKGGGVGLTSGISSVDPS